MITIKNFVEAINFKISSGSSYGWECFGPDARWLDTEDKEYSASIVFDTVNQTVYLAEVCDYVNNRAYRMINPAYTSMYTDEANKRGINDNQAWDDIKYIDLDVVDDWLEKCTAIVNKKFDYDDRVMVEINLSDEELLEFMRIAHKKDITLNQLFTQVLRAACDEAEANKI